MTNIKDIQGLKRLDGLACNLLNSFKNDHKLDLVETCLVLAVSWGRLRKAAEEVGVDPIAMDADFLHDAAVFTNALVNEDEEEENGC